MYVQEFRADVYGGSDSTFGVTPFRHGQLQRHGIVYVCDTCSGAYCNREGNTDPGTLADHRSEGIPNMLNKDKYKAVLMPFQVGYVKALMPHQLGVGVKSAADFVITGL